MGACAALVFVLGSGFGIWTALDGPEHITGPAQNPTVIAGLSSDPVGFFVPSEVQRFTFGHAALGDSLVAERDTNWHIVIEAPNENGSYVGFPLGVILLVGTIALRRRRLVQFAALMAAAGMLLSMGSFIHIDGHKTGIPLPFAVLAHLPLLDSGAASRYVEFFWLFAALLLAVFVDALYTRLDGRDQPGDRLRATVASTLVVLCALLPLVPAWPYGSGPSAVPSWFTSGARSIPVGATVVVYPFASPVDASAMLWQAMAHDTFKMPGGYAVFRSADGSATFNSDPSLVQQVLAECAGGGQPQLAPSTIRMELRSWNASLAAVVIAAPGSACATRLFDSAYGAHQTKGGVRLWTTT
jgi:dolichyl-phosphate beta-glucosyltransferase